MRTVREKAINLTGERRVDRIWGDVIRYLVLVDWLMIVATIVRRPSWSTIQLFHESRCVVARFSHRRRIPAMFASFSFFFKFIPNYRFSILWMQSYTLLINNDNHIKKSNKYNSKNKYKKRCSTLTLLTFFIYITFNFREWYTFI